MKSKKRKNKTKNIFIEKLPDLIIGIIVTIFGVIFSFWLNKTFGFSLIGG